jgi:UDP-N-acetylglucosamine 4,6-dehydratase/5-epimerase
LSLNGANILITGGTGSFGHRFVRTVMKRFKPRRLIVYSRDELKQFQMRQGFPAATHPGLEFLVGDVRDRERLYRVMDGIDLVVHAAALKQVPTAEYNPLEAIKTNILGAANVVDAASDRRVSKVLALSTDKAANPVNLYGATKLCADKLFVAANAAETAKTIFSAVRYGNVVGSRGSVIPYFLAQRTTGRISITDKRMTRFLITLKHGVDFVLNCIDKMKGGEIFVPKIPSVRVTDLVRVIAPDCKQEIIGIRPGEKLHETLVSEDDARLTVELKDRYVIQPIYSYWDKGKSTKPASRGAKPCADGFRYTSDTNTWWLDDADIARLVKGLDSDPDLRDWPSPAEPRLITGG